jgi:hypothetical protein
MNTEVLRTRDLSSGHTEDCAFSILYGDDFESLDLVASTPEEANIWVTGLNALVGAHKGKCLQLMLFLFPMARQPLGGLGCLIFRGFTITLRHTTLGRTPLDEGPARRRDLYLTTHNTQKR